MGIVSAGEAADQRALARGLAAVGNGSAGGAIGSVGRMKYAVVAPVDNAVIPTSDMPIVASFQGFTR